MANIWSDKVDTKGEYVDLGELAETTLEAETTYLFQATGTCLMCVSEEQPTSGGFTLFGGPIVRFELKSGEKVWIKTLNGLKVSMNLAQ